MPTSGEPRILLVEDDDVDAEFVRRSFAEAGVRRPIVRARDGAEALAIVRGTGAEPPLARPYVVLLDLRMPRLDGAGVLASLKADPATRDLIVFVLTTSASRRHRAEVYGLGAAGYLVKSDDRVRLAAFGRMLDAFCDLVELP